MPSSCLSVKYETSENHLARYGNFLESRNQETKSRMLFSHFSYFVPSKQNMLFERFSSCGTLGQSQPSSPP